MNRMPTLFCQWEGHTGERRYRELSPDPA